MNKKKTPAETLGQRLAGLLSTYGISPERLSEVVEMSGVQIRSIIKDESKPYRSTVEKIASALGTSVDYLMSGHGEALPKGKRDLSAISGNKAAESWKDEAWMLAKEQINKKDATIDRLSMAFDRLTEIMHRANLPFLSPVKETA